MRTDSQRAKQYRDRADELRLLMDRWFDAFAREALERLACDYDSLADRLDPPGKRAPVVRPGLEG